VAPVELHADPADVIVGDSLRLTGTTVSADSTKPVRIVVTWLRSIQTPAPPIPRPDPDTIVARFQAGEFADWYEPTREGHYSALAISPDGTGRTTIEFTAREINDWLEDLVDSVEQSVNLASELVDEGARRSPRGARGVLRHRLFHPRRRRLVALRRLDVDLGVAVVQEPLGHGAWVGRRVVGHSGQREGRGQDVQFLAGGMRDLRRNRALLNSGRGSLGCLLVDAPGVSSE
jgi:hypothetical protein